MAGAELLEENYDWLKHTAYYTLPPTFLKLAYVLVQAGGLSACGEAYSPISDSDTLL